ncbi:MAG TPA: nucleotide pyrophosphatase/phosphodiesterase family protein [Gaiellaceae bacterium]|nr:nucleotide pyrophosphatase/phosphodiesterase family protein [Gaiellaceae bacterium]
MPATSPKKNVILIVIDGLTPSMFEATDTPALRFLAEHGEYRRAVSTFPSLTPVCLSSIATGSHPDGHHIPHLVWWHRGEQRIVEYGSSFAAVRAAGIARSLRDTIVDLNARHLSSDVQTMFETLEDAGLTTAAINITCYRGRHRHLPTIPGAPAVHGPKRFFFYSLYESERTGAPLAFRNRALGSIDAYAAAIGRWLVTRDGFDLLVYYLPDYDYASHAAGPDSAHEALRRSDDSISALMDAAGGPDEFLERYAVVVCSDHGQSKVEHVARLEAAEGDLVTASNRAAMVYTADPRRAAERLDDEPAAGVVLFREDGRVVARRNGDEDAALLDELPDGRARAEAALANPNAGEVLVSAAPGWELLDLAGRHHLGGGSHGSLEASDSEVPMLTVGLGPPPASITGIKSAIVSHFAVSESSAQERTAAR